MAFAIKKIIVDVKVSDLDRAVAFYQDMLEFTLLHKAEEWASFMVAECEIHLYVHGGMTQGLEFRVRDIKTVVARLTAKGIFPLQPLQEAPLETFGSGILRFSWGKAFFSTIPKEISSPSSRNRFIPTGMVWMLLHRCIVNMY